MKDPANRVSVHGIRTGSWLFLLTLLLSAAACGGGGSDPGGAGGESGSGSGSGGGGGAGAGNPNLAKFSFFVVSVGTIRTLSQSQDGFGGDLRYGETGDGAGLRGADRICADAAEIGMPGAGSKTWRAFLSATSGGENDGPVHASSRIGTGPWFDARGRQVASTLSQLLMDRPGDADLQIKNDLPNEFGIPNHSDGAPGCSGSQCPNNHAVLTGTDAEGMLFTAVTPATESTCNDWTSQEPSGSPWCGHSWPRVGSGTNWMSSSAIDGCAPCVGQSGGAEARCVGATGGYGGFYCFAIN
jgi:hypothetical protein